MTLRLTLRPHVKPNGDHTGKFDALIGSDFIYRAREPLFDGARVLLARGYNPDTLMTTRHEGKQFDNFKPASIGAMAELATSEDKNGPRIVKWKLMSDAEKARAHQPPALAAAE